MAQKALIEVRRSLLIPAYVGDVRAWKADDPNETVVFAVRDQRQDSDDLTFYAVSKAGLFGGEPANWLWLIGTTQLGKDGWCQPIVFNDGTVFVLLAEAQDPGAPGASAALYSVQLAFRVGQEPIPTATAAGTVDSEAREAIKALGAAFKEAAAKMPG